MNQKIYKIFTKIKNNDFWKKLFKNSFFAFAGDSGAAVINLIVTILLIKILGNTNYGFLILSISYMTIVDLIINLQSWKSVIQYGQEAMVKKDYNSFFGYIKIGTILDVSTAIVGGIVSFSIAPLIGILLGWQNEIIICSKIMSTVIISHFSGTPTAVLRILNKFNLVAIQKIISAAIKLASIIFIIVLKIELNIYNIAIIYAITDIIGNLLLVIFAFYELNKKYKIKAIFKSNFPTNSKEFTKFTIWTTLSDIVDIPVQQLDVFIVSKLGIDMVSVFKFFKQVVAILSKIIKPIQQAIMPQFSELIAKGQKDKAYDIFKKIHKSTLIIFVPIAVVFGISSKIWLNIIFNDNYAKYWYVLLIFLISQCVAFSYSTIHTLFTSMGKVFYSFLYGLITNIIYLVTAYLLVNNMKMIGLIIAFTLQYGVLVFLKTKKIKSEL